jgi:H+/Cl- antiporter ClcA
VAAQWSEATSRMSRFRVAESLVMLARVLQWLVLSILMGAVVGVGCTIFLRALFATAGHTCAAPWWLQIVLLLGRGLANGLLLHYGYSLSCRGYQDSPIVAVNEQRGRMPFRALWIEPVAAIITLGCGGSAGKERPCSPTGASLGAGIGQALHLNQEVRERMLACGVSGGFARMMEPRSPERSTAWRC